MKRIKMENKNEFDVVGRPISWILLAPAVSPREPGLAEGSGPNNPSIRLVKYDTNSGQVISHNLIKWIY